MQTTIKKKFATKNYFNKILKFSSRLDNSFSFTTTQFSYHTVTRRIKNKIKNWNLSILFYNRTKKQNYHNFFFIPKNKRKQKKINKF